MAETNLEPKPWIRKENDPRQPWKEKQGLPRAAWCGTVDDGVKVASLTVAEGLPYVPGGHKTGQLEN